VGGASLKIESFIGILYNGGKAKGVFVS
jgi:hypothetical protein